MGHPDHLTHVDPTTEDKPTTQIGPDTEHDGHLLAEELYQDLRRLAQARMRRMQPGHTLQPTALVNEVYLRLMSKPGHRWDGKRHFFGAAARAMLQVLADHARQKGAVKRGKGQVRCHSIVTFADGDDTRDLSAEDVLALQRALEKLERAHPQMAELVLLRYFGGLNVREIAESWGLTTRAVEKKWSFARAWLQRELDPGAAPTDPGPDR